MKSKIENTIKAFLLIALLLGTPAALADDEPTAPAAPAADSSEMDAMMAKMKEASTPSEGHAVLEPLVGSWNASSKWWKEPSAQPEESMGTTETQWILGGRFLQEKFNGMMMRQPFEGIGITGYDNTAKKYQNVWMDSMSTGMGIGTGTYDPASKTITTEMSMSCPMEGGEKSFRGVIKLIDDDHYAYEMYTNDPKSGEEFKAMEINYTKKGTTV